LFETRRLDLLVKFLLLLPILITTLHHLITKTIKKSLQPDVDQNPAREILEERANLNPKIKAKTREEARAVLVVIQKVKTPPKMSRTTFPLLVEEEFVDLLLVEVVDHKTKRYKKKKSSRKQQFS